MYDWRQMTPKEREAVLAWRKDSRLPWHSPPHEDRGEGAYHLSAACYEHKPIIGTFPERMRQCATVLLSTVAEHEQQVFAWCVLPNHYHLLVGTGDIAGLLKRVGRFHGRQSHEWNGEDGTRGRTVWRNCVERAMRSDRHFWVTMNYIHHNPVHHGYVIAWDDWPFSSASDYLEQLGREEARRMWLEYPVLDYGKGWDDPKL